MSMWKSSQRLSGGVLVAGACLTALAFTGNGGAAGGTPMPAPDDPPPAYQTVDVKTSASPGRAHGAQGEAGCGVSRRRCRRPTPRRRVVDHDAGGARREQAAVTRPEPSPGAASPHRRPECPDLAATSPDGTTHVTTPEPRSASRRPVREEAAKAKPKPQPAAEARVTRRSRRRPLPRPGPGRPPARAAGRRTRRPLARRRRPGGRGCSSSPRSCSQRRPEAACCSGSPPGRATRHASSVVRLASLLVALAAGAATLPGGPVRSNHRPRCNGGGCGGWFRSRVTVTWAYDRGGVTGTSGCGAGTSGRTRAGATFTCTVTYGGPFVGNSVTVPKGLVAAGGEWVGISRTRCDG